MLRVRGHAWTLGGAPTIAQIQSALLQAMTRGLAVRGRLLVVGPGAGAGCRDDEAAFALREAGVPGVVAESCNAAFRESLLRHGVPVLLIPQVASLIRPGHDLIVNFAAGSCEIVDSHRMLVGQGLGRADLALVRTAAAWTRHVGATASSADTSDTLEYPA